MNISQQGGWMLVRPRRLAQARLERMDRRRLGELLRGLPPKGRLNIDQKARVSFLAGGPPVSQGWDWIGWLVSDFVLDHFGGVNDNILRVWGSLSDAQRRAARDGNPIPYASLTSEQRAVVERAVYGL